MAFSETYFLYLLASLLLIAAALKLLRSLEKPQNLPPGPPKLPIIGNLHQLGHLPHISLHHLAAKYGPIIHLQLGQVPTVVLSSARTVKDAMKNHDLALSNRPQLFSAQHLFYNCTDMVFSPYGPYWRHVRKLSLLELLSPRRVQSYGYTKEEVARLVARVTASYPDPVDLTAAVARYANDVVCRAAFGRGFSEGGDYERHGLQEMLLEFQVLLGGFHVADFFPSVGFVRSVTGFRSRLRRAFQRFDRFLELVIEEHVGRAGEGGGRQKDFVDVLLELQKDGDAEIALTNDNLKALILDMFAAGTDTSYITLDWGMTELITNPDILKRAQAEIRNIVGERKVVLENDLVQFQYLKAVVKEILRLHPPAPVLVPRESIEAITIDGYEIPAKTRFFINAWAIGRDPESWDDPEVFKPERFMGSEVDFKGQHFEFVPFGAGRRICPGIAFGMMTIELALAQLLHSFDWELPHGIDAKDLDMSEAFGITMHKISPLKLVAKPHF